MVSKKIVQKKTNESTKRELPNSLQENDNVEEQGINEIVNNVNNSQEAILIIYRYEKQGIYGKQGQILKKFKNTENFFDNVC